MALTNINFIMNLVDEYLEGKTSRIEFEFEFETELSSRYKKMQREDAEYAEIIYDWLFVAGIDAGTHFSDAQFKRLMKRQYNEVRDIADGGFC